MKKLLVVCMGNICRSPTGEAVLRQKARQQGVRIEVDSAGTIAYHQGNPPDSRAQQAAQRRGYSFQGMSARPVCLQDFADFDLILAADEHNMSDLFKICPVEYQDKLSLFLAYGDLGYDEIPDPYYSGDAGFELVLDLIEDASDALLTELKSSQQG